MFTRIVLLALVMTLVFLPANKAGVEKPESYLSNPNVSALNQELKCLALTILYEAGNQSREGQLLVARVVLNRVGSKQWADTICGVITQIGIDKRSKKWVPQFEWTIKKVKISEPFDPMVWTQNVLDLKPPVKSSAWKTAVAVAVEALLTPNDSKGATHFRLSKKKAYWDKKMVLVASVGDHSFFR